MNAAYEKYLNSTHSVFDLPDEQFVKFRKMVEESNQISNITKRRSLENTQFYYLLRDLWFLLDANLQLDLTNTSFNEKSILRALLIRHLKQHFKAKYMTSPLTHNDFSNFLFAHMLAERMMSWLDARYISNTKLASSVQILHKLNNKHRMTAMMPADELHQLQMIIVREIQMLLEKDLDRHYADFYKKIYEVTRSCQHIEHTLYTIIGEETFERKSFMEQLRTLESLYNNQSLFEIADCAVEITKFLEKDSTNSMIKDLRKIAGGEDVKKKAPLIICPTHTPSMFKNRHRVNGVILALATLAKKLHVDVYVVPFAKDVSNFFYFEEGQFNLQDMIDVGNTYLFGEQHYVDAINLATMFLRQEMELKGGQLVFITDESLDLSEEKQSQGWLDAFLKFKDQQQLSITSIVVGEQMVVKDVSLADQSVIVDGETPIVKVQDHMNK